MLANLSSKIKEKVIMAAPVKQGFDMMPGIPARDDDELSELMEVMTRLPRENVDEVARSLLRAALGYERTGDGGYLTRLAQDALVTIRLRRDPEVDRALREAPDKPADPAQTLDVEEMLRERGL
jgi:hypothetical protein